MKFTPNEILSTIMLNMDLNLEKHSNFVESPFHSSMLACHYIDSCGSNISSDINRCEDREELKKRLQSEIIEATYGLEVLHAYLDEVDRQIELDGNAFEYTFRKSDAD